MLIRIGIGIGAMALLAGSVRWEPLVTQQGAADQSTITPAMVSLGDSVFHGRVGGALCYVCHGPGAKGVNGLGPSLVDKEWLNGDGSYAFIISTITSGVPKPKKMPAPMPPKGGGQLTTDQIHAAAAYVYSLSQK